MDTNKIKERFIQNSKGFWKANFVFVIIYFIALTADGASTTYFMLSDGVDTELHPAVNIAARMTGPFLGPIIGIIGKFIAGIIVAVYWRRIAWIILLVVSIISLWAAWFNVWGWKYYTPGIFRWWPI